MVEQMALFCPILKHTNTNHLELFVLLFEFFD